MENPNQKWMMTRATPPILGNPHIGAESQTGWWFGTFFVFPYIGNNHPNWLSYFSEGSNHQPGQNIYAILYWELTYKELTFLQHDYSILRILGQLIKWSWNHIYVQISVPHGAGSYWPTKLGHFLGFYVGKYDPAPWGHASGKHVLTSSKAR